MVVEGAGVLERGGKTVMLAGNFTLYNIIYTKSQTQQQPHQKK